MALVLALAVGGCGAEPVTGAHVTVLFPGLTIDQLRFTVTPAGGDPVIARRPEITSGQAWLESPQDVLVYLPDRTAGLDVTCQATGMADGAMTAATGSATATLAMHELVPVTVVLSVPATTAPPPVTPTPTPPPACDASKKCKPDCTPPKDEHSPCCC